MRPSLIVRYFVDPGPSKHIRVWPISSCVVLNRLACDPSDCVWIVPTPNPWVDSEINDPFDFIENMWGR